MSTRRKTTSANDSEEIRARRTEKSWRHEDRELTGTYSLCRIVLAVQASFIPLSGVAIGDDPCIYAKAIFLAIVVMSFLSLLGVAAVPYLLVDYERYSAWYYGVTGSGTDYPDGFDETKNEAERKRKRERFDRYSPVITKLQLACFVLSTVLFCVIVVNK